MTADATLKPTFVLDSDHPAVKDFALSAAGNAQNPAAAAARLFDAVAYGVSYHPYSPFYMPEHYKASVILKNGRGYCVQKACLLCAACRALGIPARLGFATIRNHNATREIVEAMGVNLFVYHGYTEILLDEVWRKATPAFDKEVCSKQNIAPLVFDGGADAVFPPKDLSGNPFVEYTVYHGSFDDLPLDTLLEEWRKIYGEERVRLWMEVFETGEGRW
jgi:transglutaminase-like putative cysteine protease